MVMLASGCAHGRRNEAAPNKPYEPTEVYNFKSSAKDDAKTFQTIGLDSFKQKNWGDARAYLNKAVELDPKLYWSWYCLGLLDIDKQEGYNYLKKASEVNPAFPNAYYWMAYYHCRRQENQKAIPLFEKYIGLAKNDPAEKERVNAAQEALRELLSGKEGVALVLIRGTLRKALP